MPDDSRHSPGSIGPTSPVVGRTAERVLLQEQLEAAETGHGQLVIIGGEAGIGKTTIVRDLIANAQSRSWSVLVGHNYDLMATSPYGVWLDLADAYRRQVPESTQHTLPPVLSSHDLEGFTNGADLARQMRTFLHQLSGDHPCLLVLEDLHWADPASLELLRHVASHLHGLRLLLVATYRIDELTRENPFYLQLPALVRESEGLRLDLKRLGPEALRELVSVRYELTSEAATRLTAYLETHSEGNPFFAIELLRTLEALGQRGLQKSTTGWTLGELDRVVVPDLVRQVIDTRIARLGAPTREAISIASVIGQDVGLDLWTEVAGLDEQSLIEIIDQAVAWHLFYPDPDGTRVSFVHALTREALYESLLPLRRRLIHQRVAETLLAHEGNDPDPIAYHLRQAGDPRAPEWLIKAGERAQRAYAWLTAHDRFMDAANLLGEVRDEQLTRARLLYRCGRLQRYSNAANGIESLQTAVRLAELGGDKVLAADATYSRGLLRCFADDWSMGVGELASGISNLEALDPEEERLAWTTVNWLADALPMIELPLATDIDPAAERLAAAGVSHRRGGLPWFLASSGHLEEAQTMATAFLRHVDGISPGPLVLSSTGHAAFGLAIALASLGHADDARAAFERARDTYRRLDHHAVIAFTHLTELIDVVMPYMTTDIAERHRIANEGELALERAGGAFPAEISHRRAYLVPMYLDGRWKEVREIAMDWPIHGNYVLRRQVTRTMAPIAYHQGQISEAWRHIDGLLPAGPDAVPGSAVLLDALMLQRLAVDLCLDSDEIERARSWLDANRGWLDWSHAILGRAEHELAWGRFHQVMGDLPQAELATRRAIAEACEPMQPLALMAARRLLGEILLVGNDPGGAEIELTSALTLADACGSPFERARTLLSLAPLREQDDRAAAIAMIEEARAICELLDAGPTLKRAKLLLAGMSARETMPVPLSGLTSRELDVLRLVAEGLTDSEIGARLYISPRTASQHLRSIYGKLEVHSRAAATRYALEHQITRY